MQNLLTRFIEDESGATAIEYGLIAALIAVAMIGGAGLVGGAVENKFTAVAGAIDSAPTPGGQVILVGCLWQPTFFSILNQPLVFGTQELMLRSYLNDQSGATAIEYALIAALIAVSIIGAATTLWQSTETLYVSVSDTLDKQS